MSVVLRVCVVGLAAVLLVASGGHDSARAAKCKPPLICPKPAVTQKAIMKRFVSAFNTKNTRQAKSLFADYRTILRAMKCPKNIQDGMRSVWKKMLKENKEAVDRFFNAYPKGSTINIQSVSDSKMKVYKRGDDIGSDCKARRKVYDQTLRFEYTIEIKGKKSEVKSEKFDLGGFGTRNGNIDWFIGEFNFDR
tara:strand:+ start:521 stop:1099 length:579 start_codon:yes stop_codon:yes gene_type:complete